MSASVFASINDLVVKTIIAAEPELTSSLHQSPGGVPFRTNCFELFGFDVMFDQTLQPHLVEVSLYVCVSVCVSACLCVCLPASLYACLLVCLPVSLSVVYVYIEV